MILRVCITAPVSTALRLGLMLCLTLGLLNAARGDCIPGQPGRCGQSEAACPNGCRHVCPRCGCEMVCRTYASMEKVKDGCWDVECKDVCIPAVRFPWQKCAVNSSCDGLSCLPGKCGKVRTVQVLKRKDTEKDKCVYEHKVECACGCCLGSGAGCAEVN